MALEKFTFNEGTTDNPVVLSQRQINGLVALSQDSNVTKNCSGVVKSVTGKMYKSEYNAITGLGFTIVETEQLADIFTLYCPTTGNVLEGNRVKLYSTGIPISQLHLEVVLHEIVIDSGNISEDVIKSRIHIVGDEVVVDAAQENASWRDSITIQAYPTYDTSNKININAPITIKAVALTGVSLTCANNVLIGKTTTVETALIPTNSTKTNYSIALSCTNGVLATGTYTAPETPCTDTIVAQCYLFGGTNPTFRVEKTISVKQPTIICEIKDKDGEEVEGAYLTITDGVTGVASQLENGETMTAVLNRTYSVEAYVPTGYTKCVVAETITPATVETTISALYYPLQLGVMAVFKDGSYMPYDEWMNAGLPNKNADNSPLIGAGFVESNGDSYITCFDTVSKKWSNSNIDIASVAPIPNSIEGCLATTQEKAKNCTQAIVSIMSANGDTSDNCVAIWCQSKTIEISGETRQGWLGSCRQIKNIGINQDSINSIRSVAGLSTIYPNSGGWWSCQQAPVVSSAWRLYDGSPASYNKTGSNVVLVFHDL